jgi:diguanylate cyclase (GGDEF)-like protein
MAKGSMRDPRWRRLARLRLFCNSCCIFSTFFGCLGICRSILASFSPRLVLVNFAAVETDTSLGLTFLGISLWLLLPDPPRRTNYRLGLWFASLAASVGALRLFEDVGRLNLGIDSMLLGNGRANAVHIPSRMPPVTAITFLVLGSALLLADVEIPRGGRPTQVLTFWGLFAGVMSLSGYINDASPLYSIFSYTHFDVCVALVLFFMSIAILFIRPQKGIARDLTGRFMGSTMARRFLPAVITIPLVAAWLRTESQRAGLYGIGLSLAFNVTVNIVSLSLLVWLNARQLNHAEESLEAAREAKDTFYYASLKDELTGLYNRRGFLVSAKEQIELACSGRRELLVLFGDVDGLKTINDVYGHSEGDRALKKAAEVLVAVFRDTDVIARLGGDEFAVLALDCSPAGLVRIKAHFEKLLRAFNNQDNPWNLSMSLGAVHVDSRHQLSIDDLLKKADEMMYERKRAKVIIGCA